MKDTTLPTLSWDLPLPEHYTGPKKTIYTREIEYKKGKKDKFLVCHLWHTGEYVLLSPIWANKRLDWDLNDIIIELPQDATEKQKETFAFFQKNRNMKFKGKRKRGVASSEDLNGTTMRMRHTEKRIDCEEINGIYTFRFFRFCPHTPADGEIYDFEEYKRIFVDPNKIWTEYKNEPDVKYEWDPKNYKKIMNSLNRCYGQPFAAYNESFIKYLRRYWANANYSCDANSAFEYYPTNRRDNAYQRKIDNLNQLIKEETPKEVCEQLSKTMNTRSHPIYGATDKYFVCERLADNAAVVRMFMTNTENTIIEYARCFYDDTDVYMCYNNKGSVSRCDVRNHAFYRSENNMQLITKGTVIEKKYQYLEDMNNTSVVYQLILSYNYPVFEQLYKLGFKQLCDDIALDDYRNRNFYRIRSVISDMKRLGPDELGKHTTIKDLLTTSQIKRLSLFKDCIQNSSDFSHCLRLITDYKITDMNILRYLADIAMQEESLMTINRIDNVLWVCKDRLNTKQMNSCVYKFVEQVKALNKDDFYSFSYTRDVYSLCSDAFLDDQEFYRNVIEIAKIRDVDKIHEVHEKMSKLAKFATMDPKRFQAICDRLKDREFEDEDFIVRLPRSADEIVEEGSKMHHCVGTYIKQVVSGRTIILFLRRKSDIDKEYVTIEMTNDGILRQLKCKNNAVLSSASTLKFVEKWIKAKKLGVDTYDISYTKKKVTPGSAAYAGYFQEKDSIV